MEKIFETRICWQVQFGPWPKWWFDFRRQSGKGENRFQFLVRTRAKGILLGRFVTEALETN
jgi:hypothetical protein